MKSNKTPDSANEDSDKNKGRLFIWQWLIQSVTHYFLIISFWTWIKA
jgi:hypothetical protein